MTVRKQVLFMLLAFSIIPMIVITVIHLSTNIKESESLQLNRLSAIAHTSASAFKEIVRLRKDEVSLLASSKSISNYLNAKQVYGDDSDITKNTLKEVSDYFHTYVENLAPFDDLVLLDKKGVIVTGYYPESDGRDLSDYDYFLRVNENKDYVFSSKVHDSLIFPTDPDKKCIALSKALLGEGGEILGVLVAYLNVDVMSEFSKSISFGDTGLAFVIDLDNYILYHPEQRFYNSYTAAPQLINLLERWKKGEAPNVNLLYDLMDGVRRIYYYEVMEEIELVLILRQNYDEFSADRNSAVIFSIVSGLLTSIFVFLFGLVFSKNFVKPIIKLKESFASGTKEGVYVLCQLPLNNELGQMAKNYNEMITKLENQYELLKIEKDKNKYNAFHDRITSLYNRVAFEQELSKLLLPKTVCGVFFIDINSFRHINDFLGYPVGDSILKEFGKRVLESAVDFDICAHAGGDKFILAKECDGAEDTQDAAQLFFEELNKPFVIGDITTNITVCIGIAVYPNHGLSVDSLITNANIALYQAKKLGKNSYSLYTDEMRYSFERKNSVMDVLHHCVEKREVFFMYQPVYDFVSKDILGFEALMRIKNSELGLLSPLEFIPLAESEGALANKIGVWGLRTACNFVKTLIKETAFDGFICVNIFSSQLSRDTFIEEVVSILNEEGVSPKYFQFEITERMTAASLENHIQKLTALRELGITVALDDFGMHSYSFYNLIHLPLDVLKVDSSFYNGIDSNERIEFINKAIFDLAHKFGLRIVAEGVENQIEYDSLKAIDCDMLQGHLTSLPLSEKNAILKLTAN